MRAGALKITWTVAMIGALLTALSMVGTVSVQAVAPVEGASITGTVTVPAGVDAARVMVEARQESTRESRAVSLNSDGSYALAGLAGGPYTIHFAGHNSGAVDQWYMNASSYATAEIVTLMEGQQLNGINATLVRGATISGTLTAPAGVTLTATIVSAGGDGHTSPVAADGTYQVVGLPAGSHKLWFSGDGNALPQYYNSATSWDAATSITVSEGEDVTGINATLVKGASISGTVTAGPGVDLQATRVLATPPGTTLWTEDTWVAADGSYRIVGLPAGQYDVEFRGFNNGGLEHQWYNNALNYRESTRITLAEGQDVTGIDAALVKAASISGTVAAPPGVDLSNVKVSVYATGNPSSQITGTISAKADGSYKVSRLPAGSYTMKFDGDDSGAALQWYNDAATFDAANVIVLGTGEDLTGVNTTLVKGASISGTVTTPGGVWDYHVAISLYPSDPQGAAIKSAYRQHDGSYIFKGLRAGSYKVEVADTNDWALDQWYDNADTRETASVVTVSEGQDVTGINATLVRNTGGGPPPPGSQMRLNDFNGDARTDVIARDSSGELWLYPGRGTVTGDWFERMDLGAGWNVMSAIVTAGDFDGDSNADVIARDHSGELWLYPGAGTGDWFTRQNLGSGWNVMSSIVAPGDFNGDGKPDVIARDTSGELWLYPSDGEGDWFKRASLGSGWNIMSSIAAPGDFNRDSRVDLLARDNSGQLWLYPGNGLSEWFNRVDLGAGWNTMTAITAPGDMNRDGGPDVVARDTTGELWLYPNNGAGDWLKRIDLGAGWNQMTAIL